MRRRCTVALLAFCTAGLLFAAGNRWAMYEHEMQDPVDDPPDAAERTEFVFARLRFRSPRDGWSYSRWGIDANRGDRHFISGIRRLTRTHVRSIEEIVDIDSEAMYDYPYIFAVATGDWSLSDAQAARLRAYFDRGGFMMTDDLHGEREWASFMAGLRKIYPAAEVIELPDDHPMFHTAYDLTNRVRVPGANVVHGPGYERDGVTPHWRAVLDPKGRVVIAVCFNMDIGDGWEFADDPSYPERYASEAWRIGINYLLYSFTH